MAGLQLPHHEALIRNHSVMLPVTMAGLAAIIALLLVAFAVLICCYIRILSGCHQTTTGQLSLNEAPHARLNQANQDIGLGNTRTLAEQCGKTDDDEQRKVVVIMAGSQTPSYLAFPSTPSNTGAGLKPPTQPPSMCENPVALSL